MAEERVQRRLAAILAADVVGYSRLIEADEEGTRARLRDLHAELINPRIAADGGRIVKTMGDGILVEFPSAVDAVRNALEIQRAIRHHSADVTKETRIEFRVGINVGDVIVEGDDIHGDGVNVAARLEGLCGPGEVYISGTVYDQVAGRLTASYEDLGEQTVKNITKPVRVYRARVELNEDLPPEPQAGAAPLPLPDKPSIAVLPFDNLSGDEDQEYFADGLTEELITALSKSEDLFVIARNSSFAFRGGNVDIQAVGKQLGARYVLEGSIRRAGNRLRITAQLIEASTRQHIWADRFDGFLEDVFSLQDDITLKIVGQLLPKVERAEIDRASRKATHVVAYDLFLRALRHFHAFSADDIKSALEFLETALRSNPDDARALALSGVCRARMVINRWDVANERQNIELGLNNASRAPLISPDDSSVLWMSGFAIGRLSGDYRRGLEFLERAKVLNPNSYYAFGFAGLLKTLLGEAGAAIDDLEFAVRLNPIDPRSFTFHTSLANAYNQNRRYEDAMSNAAKAIQQNSRYEQAHREYGECSP